MTDATNVPWPIVSSPASSSTAAAAAAAPVAAATAAAAAERCGRCLPSLPPPLPPPHPPWAPAAAPGVPVLLPPSRPHAARSIVSSAAPHPSRPPPLPPRDAALLPDPADLRLSAAFRVLESRLSSRARPPPPPTAAAAAAAAAPCGKAAPAAAAVVRRVRRSLVQLMRSTTAPCLKCGWPAGRPVSSTATCTPAPVMPRAHRPSGTPYASATASGGCAASSAAAPSRSACSSCIRRRAVLGQRGETGATEGARGRVRRGLVAESGLAFLGLAALLLLLLLLLGRPCRCSESTGFNELSCVDPMRGGPTLTSPPLASPGARAVMSLSAATRLSIACHGDRAEKCTGATQAALRRTSVHILPSASCGRTPFEIRVALSCGELASATQACTASRLDLT